MKTYAQRIASLDDRMATARVIGLCDEFGKDLAAILGEFHDVISVSMRVLTDEEAESLYPGVYSRETCA
jgi:hypothetical protein